MFPVKNGFHNLLFDVLLDSFPSSPPSKHDTQSSQWTGHMTCQRHIRWSVNAGKVFPWHFNDVHWKLFCFKKVIQDLKVSESLTLFTAIFRFSAILGVMETKPMAHVMAGQMFDLWATLGFLIDTSNWRNLNTLKKCLEKQQPSLFTYSWNHFFKFGQLDSEAQQAACGTRLLGVPGLVYAMLCFAGSRVTSSAQSR